MYSCIDIWTIVHRPLWTKYPEIFLFSLLLQDCSLLIMFCMFVNLLCALEQLHLVFICNVFWSFAFDSINFSSEPDSTQEQKRQKNKLLHRNPSENSILYEKSNAGLFHAVALFLCSIFLWTRYFDIWKTVKICRIFQIPTFFVFVDMGLCC